MLLRSTALALILLATPAFAAPKVITSVLPVHGIVSAVMGDTGAPELLLDGSLSAHRATFTPAQVASLGKADLVFIVGHSLEAKLAQLSGSEAVNGKAFVELSEAPGIRTLPIREGGAWDTHDHDHGDGHDHDHAKAEDHDHDHAKAKDHDHDHAKAEDHDHDHAKAEDHDHDKDHVQGVLTFDPHVWLDPENAKAMAAAAAAELANADPANAATYKANAAAFAAQMEALSVEIAAELEPVKDRPFVVFHDAYQYFEARFGLMAVGSISDVSAQSPSAARLQEVRGKIASSKAVCVFREPQFDSRTVDVVIEGTAARAGVLDPLGASLTPGREAYPELLRQLAKGLKDCLGG